MLSFDKYGNFTAMVRGQAVGKEQPVRSEESQEGIDSQYPNEEGVSRSQECFLFYFLTTNFIEI